MCFFLWNVWMVSVFIQLLWTKYDSFWNCIELLLKWTAEMIYLQNLLTTLLEFVLTVYSPHNHKILILSFLNFFFYFNYIYFLPGTKYVVLQFQSSLFIQSSCCSQCGSIYRREGRTGVMWSDVEPPASPSGRCRWACPRLVWRRRDAPDTSGQWSAGLADGAAVWQICK